MSIKHSLLALLSQQPSTASQLQKQLEECTDHVWKLNPGQVAQTVKRLLRDELVESSGLNKSDSGRNVKTYAITDKGNQVLTAWFHSALSQPVAERDELVIKVALATQRDDVDLVALLDKQRFATLKEVKELHTKVRELPQTRSTLRLTIERQVFELEGLLRWLDRVEALAPIRSASPAQEGK